MSDGTYEPVEILLVEDNPQDAEITLRALKRANFANHVQWLEDGEEALKRIKADSRTRSIPVVILTSSKEETDLVRSYDLGVNSYLVKPVDFQRF